MQLGFLLRLGPEDTCICDYMQATDESCLQVDKYRVMTYAFHSPGAQNLAFSHVVSSSSMAGA